MSQSSFPVWFPWVLAALTGGLVGTALNLFMNWLRAKSDEKRVRRTQIDALKQELRHALWLIGYNYGRITEKRLSHKGVATIDSSNMQRILFGASVSLPLQADVKDRLLDCYQQIVYHNSLVKEQETLLPSSINDEKTNRQRAQCLGELETICTPNDKYREYDSEPSIRARVRRLLQDLDEIKIR